MNIGQIYNNLYKQRIKNNSFHTAIIFIIVAFLLSLTLSFKIKSKTETYSASVYSGSDQEPQLPDFPSATIVVQDTSRKKRTGEENNKADSLKDNNTFTPGPFQRITYAKSYNEMCKGIVITCASITSSTCKYEAAGSITIDLNSVQGGIGPYYFSFEGEKFTIENSFEYLSVGEYSIRVKDQKGCETLLKPISVTEKECEEIREQAFSPYRRETWHIPIKEKVSCEFKIINNSGVVVYSRQIAAGENAVWDGKESQGRLVEPGYYTYVIVYENNRQEQGHLTILK